MLLKFLNVELLLSLCSLKQTNKLSRIRAHVFHLEPCMGLTGPRIRMPIWSVPGSPAVQVDQEPDSIHAFIA